MKKNNLPKTSRNKIYKTIEEVKLQFFPSTNTNRVFDNTKDAKNIGKILAQNLLSSIKKEFAF